MKNIVVAIVLTAFLSSCKEEKREGIYSKSPDGSITLTVAAIRQNSLDPWETTLKADGTALKAEIVFEFYAGDVSNQNVSFVWDRSGNCTITFMQRDDTKRIFEFTPDNSSIMWRDLTEK